MELKKEQKLTKKLTNELQLIDAKYWFNTYILYYIIIFVYRKRNVL